LGNILQSGEIGLIFLLPGTEESLRVNGRAALYSDDDICTQLAANGKPAKLIIQVSVRECFFHCAKAFKRSRSWQPESWPEKHKISFGKHIAANATNNAISAKVVSMAVDQAVKTDYKNNL
jgi:predicted pyridoxine 5'-phosphate oxidase superfamily flavin-nucleotide-binding protein